MSDASRSPTDERERTRTGTAPAGPGVGTQAPARTSRPTHPRERLSTFVADPDRVPHRVLAAGDLNIDYGLATVVLDIIHVAAAMRRAVLVAGSSKGLSACRPDWRSSSRHGQPALMRTETFQKRASTSGKPPAVADGTSTVGHRSPSPLPHHDHALTDPTASCLATVAETGWAADEKEPHPIDYGLDYGWRQSGDQPLMYTRCRTVWDRMEALGLEYMGPRYPNGRRATPTPKHAPAETKNVPTHHSNQSSPADARLQLDHVFASQGFHESIKTRALNEVDEWGPSDHARLQIDVE